MDICKSIIFLFSPVDNIPPPPKKKCIPLRKKKGFSARLSPRLLRTNSDSALHTSALSTKPQDPYGGGGQSAWPAPYMGKTHRPLLPASGLPASALCAVHALPSRVRWSSEQSSQRGSVFALRCISTHPFFASSMAPASLLASPDSGFLFPAAPVLSQAFMSFAQAPAVAS